jgi:hypothetical protein
MRPSPILVTCLALVALGWLAPPTGATPINAATTGLATPDVLITFSEIALPDLTPIGNAYAAFGVTFGPEALYALPGTHSDSGPNFDPPDVVNFSDPDASWVMTFAHPLSAIAFAYAGDDTTTTFTALLGNTIVEQFSAFTTFGPGLTNNYFGFEGIVFDRLEISYLSGDNGLDNLQFVSVPEPSALLLVAFGLAGLAIRRRA